MTNPVVLYGTQSNGETLPVQVDATGRLVAEGLEGPPGPEGPEGPEGPPGPAGEASVTKSIQHVNCQMSSNSFTLRQTIVPVNDSKAFISLCGYAPQQPGDPNQNWEAATTATLSFIGPNSIEITRAQIGVTMNIAFDVIEFN